MRQVTQRRGIGWERILMRLIVDEGLPKPICEHPFSKAVGRRHRFDLAWPEQMLALEIDGGVWIGGRHNRGSGFLRDQEKGNLAVLLGWRVLHCTPQDIQKGATLLLLKEALQ